MNDKLLFSETTVYPDGFTISEGGQAAAAEGKSLVMTVNGVNTAPKPGTYAGRVVFEVIDALPSIGKVSLPSMFSQGRVEPVKYENEYRSALLVDADENGTFIVDGKSAKTAIVGAQYDNNGIKGGSITSRDERFNGVLVLDGEYRVSDMKFDFEGHGGDDFELFGAAVAAGGNSRVIVENVDIETKGCIATTVAAAEKAVVLVKDSKIKSTGWDNTGYNPGTMIEVPWVLSINGTVRTSNVVGNADVTFYNVSAESNGWGVFSTDDVFECRHNIINTSATIKPDSDCKSGYGAYVLGTTNSRYLGAEFNTASHGLIFAGCEVDVFIGASSKENLMRHLGPDSLLYKETDGFADVYERNTIINSHRFGIMWHGMARGAKVGTLYIEEGSEINSKEAALLIKAGGGKMPNGQEALGISPIIKAAGAKINAENGVLLHFMESDDPGMGADHRFSDYYLVPEINPVPFPGHNRCDFMKPGTLKASFSEMEVSGDIYNSVWRTPQNLDVELDKCRYTGAITTGVQYHKNFKPGEKITPEDRFELGVVGVTPVPDYVNGLIVTMRRGATWEVTGTSYLSMFVMFDGSDVTAPDSKRVIMTVDGARKTIKPGIYRGDIRFELIDEMTVLGKTEVPDMRGAGMKKVRYEHQYESALLVDVDDGGNTVIVPEKSAVSMIVGAQYDNKGIKGGSIVNEVNAANGILVADGEYRIEDMKIRSLAHGGDDFEAYGSMISAAGNSRVVVDNVDIDSVGCICTAASAVEKADLLVMNSRIKTVGLDPWLCWADSMTEVPWVLGLKGSVRSTNVCDAAMATYYNCDMKSNGWGVLSTDDIAEGAHHNMVNTKAEIIEDGIFDSGYVVYILGRSQTKFFGVEMRTPDYPITFGGNSHDIFIGSSSKENLVKYLGTESLLARETNGYADVEERKTVLKGGAYALMWHHVCTGKVTVEDSYLSGDRMVFLIKAKEGNMFGMVMPPSSPALDVRNCVLESKNGVILHLMENDDAGMGTDCHDLHWASSYTVPNSTHVAVPGWDAADPAARSTVRCNFADMDIDGDFYNTRFGSGHNLDLTFANVKINGVISGGRQYHVGYKPGDVITPENPRELGNVGCIPCPVAANGVIVTVKDGSVWTVTGESFISSLTVEDGASVVAAPGRKLVFTVDGEEKELIPGKYVGNVALRAIDDAPAFPL